MSEPRVVLAPNPSPMTLDGTRTYLIGTERPAIIDPGPADPRHLRATLQALGGAIPVAILLTHTHADHAAGAAVLARRTGAPVQAAPGALSLPDGLEWKPLGEGGVVDTDAGPLLTFATPGHTPDGLSWLWRAEGADALFVGDLMMGEGDTTLVAPPDGDLCDYLRSLERVRELAPAAIFPAHGPPLRDPAAAVERFRRHRLERIDAAWEALRRAGAARPAELLGAVYGDAVPPALRGAAEASLRAVLEYLVAAGRAERLPDGRYNLR